MAFIGYLLLVSVAVLTEATYASNRCPSKWDQEISLDSNRTVVIQSVAINGNLTVNMIGKSKGWVGVGFSPTGGMTGADIVMGWVKDRKPYLMDCHATHNGRPFLDKVQSYELLGGSENATHTSICWTRKLDTCDDEDLPIQTGIQKLIWAFNNEDPATVSMEAPKYHDHNRGTKDIRLLNKAPPKPSLAGLQTFDILSYNLTLPDNLPTLYWCSVSKLPKMAKHHMIGYEPRFQNGGEEYFHHLLIYQCPGQGYDSLYEELPSKGYDCNSVEMMKYRTPCMKIIASWAVGMEGFFFPPDVAFPFGNPEENSYYLLEVHYNIMNNKYVGKKDNSGIRMYYTDKLRKHDGGMFMVGQNITPFHVIPARQQNFSTIGLCNPECTQKLIPSSGINIFAIFFHTHMAGRKVRLHIFRNGIEKKILADEHFDFSYQQPVSYDKEIKIYPNDLLMAECVYDTSDRSNTTVGYFGSDDEMCIILINIYPAINMTWCESTLVDPKFLKLIGVEEYIQIMNDVTVVKPEAFANRTLNEYLHQLNLTNEDAAQLQEMNFNLPQRTDCLDLAGQEIPLKSPFVAPPKINRTLQEAPSCVAKTPN